ncbi:MAG: hypothetical protein QOD82_8 [Pseudonocardiales bacterium]|nr:hypothetical protein [Pseudonocardiales bacterium]
MPRQPRHRVSKPSADIPTEQLTVPPAQPAGPNAPSLTINKVLAGAGAAATSAVLGSLFGAAGTVTGAALGSMVVTLSTAVYNHSLDRTRDTVTARIKHSGGPRMGRTGRAEVPAPRDAPDRETDPPGDLTLPTEPPAAAARPKQRIGVLAAATVLLFALGMGVVTGIELIKGSTLTRGQHGTSIGQLISGGGPPTTAIEAPTTESPTTTSATPSPTTTPSEEPTTGGASQPVPSAGPVVPNPNSTPAPVTLTPTTGPTPGPTKSGTPQPAPSAGPSLELPGTGPR